MTVPFKTARHAEIAYDSLRVDPEPKRGGTKRKMAVEGAVLKVTFTHLKVAIITLTSIY